MFTYQPPAGIDDLAGRPTRTTFLAAWHTAISNNVKTEIQKLPAQNKLFFSEEQSPATSADLPVTWNAFPLSLRRDFPNQAVQRWDAADRLRALDRGPNAPPKVLMPFRPQDEYCEWHAYRDTEDGPIRRIVFTAEAPEYWVELARHDFDQVLALYRQWVSPAVQPDELKLQQAISFGSEILPAGSYNPYNVWNTSKGCVHLTHHANTLGAEINLAARATIPRKDVNGHRITDVRRFACASDFGDPNRSSDPNIGSGVNLTVLPAVAGAPPQSVTLSNPVALYMDRIAAGVITDKDGNPLVGWFRFVRGVQGHGLMAVLEPPVGAVLGLDKVFIDGAPLTHGGQVAEHIQMVLYAKTANLHQPVPALQLPVGHCCMQNDGKPPEKVNFEHSGPSQACSGEAAKEAFPEIVGGNAGAQLPGTGGMQTPQGNSRLRKPSEAWNG